MERRERVEEDGGGVQRKYEHKSMDALLADC